MGNRASNLPHHKETTIRYEIDHEDDVPEDDEALVANERLREWFERQIGPTA